MNEVASPWSLAAAIRPGQSLYIAGGPTPPAAFIKALQENPARSAGLRITSTVAPGLPNPFVLEQLDPTTVFTGPFMVREFASSPDMNAAGASDVARPTGQFHHQPMSASGFLRYLKEQTFDLGVIQVAPPDANGRCSLGPGVEFLPIALQRCRRLVAVVHPQLPSLPQAAWVPASALEAVYEDAEFQHNDAGALPDVDAAGQTPTDTIGRLIAGLIEDGSTIQLGHGVIPAATAGHLHSHRQLRIHAGLASDALMHLANAGALDGAVPHHVAAVTGSAGLHQWLADAENLHVVGYAETLSPTVLARLQHFVAINPAHEIDLFGQCDLGHLSAYAVTGAPEAPDFARAARNCADGLSIVALRATTNETPPRSRIVPTLRADAAVSIPRIDVDAVVTEFGVADLRNESVHERAQALIAVAAPPFREGLARAWAERAGRL